MSNNVMNEGVSSLNEIKYELQYAGHAASFGQRNGAVQVHITLSVVAWA